MIQIVRKTVKFLWGKTEINTIFLIYLFHLTISDKVNNITDLRDYKKSQCINQ